MKRHFAEYAHHNSDDSVSCKIYRTSKFLRWVFLIICPFFTVLGAIMIIVSLVQSVFDFSMLMMLMFPLVMILIFMFRKYVFNVFVVDDIGIANIYRKKEMKRILWEELDEIKTFWWDITFTSQEKKSKRDVIKLSSPGLKQIQKIYDAIEFYRVKYPNISQIKHLNWKGEEIVK